MVKRDRLVDKLRVTADGDPDLALRAPRPGLAGARQRPPEQGECGLLKLAFFCREDHPDGEA